MEKKTLKMSKKTFNLVTACIGGAETIACGIVTFCCEPTNASLINGAIIVAGTAAIEICSRFVKD